MIENNEKVYETQLFMLRSLLSILLLKLSIEKCIILKQAVKRYYNIGFYESNILKDDTALKMLYKKYDVSIVFDLIDQNYLGFINTLSD